jgi:hypothetical protein
MTRVTYGPIRSWPDGWDRQRPSFVGSPFSASWPSTLTLLNN